MELVRYNKNKHESILRNYITQKEIMKYTNKGFYFVTSLLGIYHTDFYLLLNDEKILGCIGLRQKLSKTCKREYWIYNVCIFSEYRGKGYSKELMKLAINNSPSPYVKLVVNKDNIVAINLYNRIGFYKKGMRGDMIIMRYDKV